ncbi:unnamed protein product [Vitrella brassicaformis CCMP3155]|uniref:CR-type domain-containing protein n=1 Tax=Vitrella brassicaformis (strain CCMP3155) TaxID=1169540 RepID=A0A0G4FEC5_VITBC|nr:unnamed protein product [Vitrella brassicaformis CCMP3155]|eukprot:CEM11567.1 unnamed protein product [Vitrella brassicaformis CCMP3155]
MHIAMLLVCFVSILPAVFSAFIPPAVRRSQISTLSPLRRLGASSTRRYASLFDFPPDLNPEHLLQDIWAFLEVINPAANEDIRRVGASAAWVGGSVGVAGSLTAIMLKAEKVKSRDNCAFCKGSGALVCGNCHGNRFVLMKRGGGNIEEADEDCRRYTCPTCNGLGIVTCVNCQGDGLAIPPVLNRKRSRDPEGPLEDRGLA